uniref:Uncharacterized protein n=1 Tax=Geladintestivirus 2 TaxID=3233134 RepID=A0AAU8MKI3_9CAUD
MKLKNLIYKVLPYFIGILCSDICCYYCRM